MDNLIISKMKSEHLDGVLAVEKDSFPKPWSKQSFIEELSNDKAYYWVALKDNIVIGYIGIWHILDEGHITNIAVHSSYRRNKVASALLNHTINYIEKKGVIAITLEVRKSNVPAIEFYKKFRFIVEGIRKGYYSNNNEDAYIMWRYKGS